MRRIWRGSCSQKIKNQKKSSKSEKEQSELLVEGKIIFKCYKIINYNWETSKEQGILICYQRKTNCKVVSSLVELISVSSIN